MKKQILMLLVGICGIVNAQNVSLNWAKSIGSSNSDKGYSIAVDASGNVYTAGIFKGTVDFDPGSGTTNLTSAGNDDAFISKLDASGNCIWAKSFGGTGVDLANSIFIDAIGNLYVTGAFQGTVDFDPGSSTNNLTSIGSPDAFIIKLSGSGNFIWAKQFGGTIRATGNSIKVDATGSVYTTGFFEGTVDFDPGSGTTNFTSINIGDAFISKLDGSGNFIWAKQLGGTSGTQPSSIFVDATGNVYTTGSFGGTTDFDPGSGTYNFMVAGWGGDTYISKLDISGNFVWAKQMVGSAYAGGSSITVDASGNIYTTGTYIGGVDFDPGPGIYNLSSGGSTAFISKLDVSGNFLWAKHFIEQTGFSSNSGGNSIALDVSNNIYITGTFQDTVDFDPGTGVNNLISTGMTSIYVSKLDASGNFIWAQRMGGYQLGAGGEGDQGNSIAVYGPDYIYTTGNFQSTSDFDPSAGVYNLTSAGAEDIFIAKLCQNTPPQPTITASGATTFCQGDNTIIFVCTGCSYLDIFLAPVFSIIDRLFSHFACISSLPTILSVILLSCSCCSIGRKFRAFYCK